MIEQFLYVEFEPKRNSIGFIRRLIEKLEFEIREETYVEFGSKEAYTHVWVLATSHAVLSTYPEHKKAVFQLSSCKPFQELPILKTLSDEYGQVKLCLSN